MKTVFTVNYFIYMSLRTSPHQISAPPINQKFNSVIPYADYHQISPYNINPENKGDDCSLKRLVIVQQILNFCTIAILQGKYGG